MRPSQCADSATYAGNYPSDPNLDALRRLQSRPDDLRRLRKHYSTVFLSKWMDHLDRRSCDIREHTFSHIVQAIDYGLLRKTSCPTIVRKLLDLAFGSSVPFDMEKSTRHGYDKQEEADILVTIGQAFDEM